MQRYLWVRKAELILINGMFMRKGYNKIIEFALFGHETFHRRAV
jgi:hypothetical protein